MEASKLFEEWKKHAELDVDALPETTGFCPDDALLVIDMQNDFVRGRSPFPTALLLPRRRRPCVRSHLQSAIAFGSPAAPDFPAAPVRGTGAA